MIKSHIVFEKNDAVNYIMPPKKCAPPKSVQTLKRIDLDEGDSWIMFGSVPEELTMDEATFESLWEIHPEEYNTVMMYGREVKTPRWQHSYGQPYYYSGIMHEASALKHPYLKKVQKWVNEHSGENYMQVLVNWYKAGQHYIIAHSDD